MTQPTGPSTAPRRPPLWKRWWFWLIVAVVGIGIISGIGRSIAGAGQPPIKTEPAISSSPVEQKPSSPEPEPTPSVLPETEPPAPASVATAEEVVAVFQAYLDERSSSGVQFAHGAVAAFADGIVAVTLNLSPELLSLGVFDNYAEFAGTPIAFSNDEGKHLRTAVTSVVTVNADGTPLGSATIAELYEMGTGSPYTPGA